MQDAPSAVGVLAVLACYWTVQVKRRPLAAVPRLVTSDHMHAPPSLQVRHVIYHKGLEADIDIASPAMLGGLGSDTYKAVNPQGKMPLLLLPDSSAIPESEVRTSSSSILSI